MPKNQTAKRKLSHIQTSLHEQVQSHVPTGFDDVRLIHKALPEIDRAKIDLSTDLFGHIIRAPIIIESMTGGTPLAAKINRTLAKVAEKLGIGMGVGSQRAGIEDENLAYTYRVAREAAPSIPLFANLGCPQISREDGLERAKKAVDMIDATGLFIHLNALQESVQFEGETDFNEMTSRIGKLARRANSSSIGQRDGCGHLHGNCASAGTRRSQGNQCLRFGRNQLGRRGVLPRTGKTGQASDGIGNNLLGLGNPNRSEYRRSCQLHRTQGLCLRRRQERAPYRKGYRAGSPLRRPSIANAQIRIIGRRGRSSKPNHSD